MQDALLLKNSNRIPSYRSRKQKCPVWGIFYIPKNKTEALNEHTTINLHCRNRKLQKHFPCKESTFSSRDPLCPSRSGIWKRNWDTAYFTGQAKDWNLPKKGMFFYQKAQEMLKDWNRFKEEVISGTEHKKIKNRTWCQSLFQQTVSEDCQIF